MMRTAKRTGGLSRRLSIGGVAFMLLAGCASSSLLADVEQRVKVLELERERLKAQMEQDVSRLTNLHGMLTEAEETLRRSGVKLGIRMEQVEESLPALKEEVDSLNFRLAAARHGVEVVKREIFDRLKAYTVYLPADLPSKADDIFKLAQKRQNEEKSREARALYDYFEANFPEHPKADDALMAIGNILEGDGDVSEAIKVYQSVHDTHSKGDQVSKALWRIGEIFVAREDCDRAKSVFDYLAQSYAESPEGQDAVAKVKDIKTTCGAE